MSAIRCAFCNAPLNFSEAKLLTFDGERLPICADFEASQKRQDRLRELEHMERNR